MGLVAAHQLSTFSSPVNGTAPIDANTVRGNDNTIKTSYNLHDSDVTIHMQNGPLASRPAASTAGQMWMTTDVGAQYIYLDTGSAWDEIDYLHSGGSLGPISIISTTQPQLTVGYDALNNFTVSVASNGAATFDAIGAGARFIFSDAVQVTSAGGWTIGDVAGVNRIDFGASIASTYTFVNAANALAPIAALSGTFSGNLNVLGTTTIAGLNVAGNIAFTGLNPFIAFSANYYIQLDSGTGVQTWYSNSVAALTIANNGANIAFSGGLLVAAGTIYAAGDIGFTNTGASGNYGLYTLGTVSPSMLFDHRGTGNLGQWLWRNTTAGAATIMTLSAAGTLSIVGGFVSTLGTGYGVLIGGGATNVWGWYTDASGAYFRNQTTGNTIVLTFNNAGGVTVPLSLNVNGAMTVASTFSVAMSAPAIVVIDAQGGGANDAAQILYRRAAATKWQLGNNVSIGGDAFEIYSTTAAGPAISINPTTRNVTIAALLTVAGSTGFSVGAIASTNRISFTSGGAGLFSFVNAANALSSIEALVVTGTAVTSLTTLTATSSISAGAGSAIGWAGRTALVSPGDGELTLYNNAQTDFNRLRFGGTTASFPMLSRGATTLNVRLADNSAFAPLSSGNHFIDGVCQVANVVAFTHNANAGSLCLINTTVGGTPSGGGYLYVAAGALNYKGTAGTNTVIAPA